MIPILFLGGLLVVLIAAGGGKAKADPRRLPPVPPPQPPIPPIHVQPPIPDIPGVPPVDIPPLDPVGPPPDYYVPPTVPPEHYPPVPVVPPQPPEIEPATPPGTTPPVLDLPSGPIYIKSPFAAFPQRSWSKFVQLMARGKEGTITAGARYGLFGFGVRRLADLGLVTDVKRGTYRGKTVWTGQWVKPYSESLFLTSSKLQYQTLVKSVKEHAKKYVEARRQNPSIFRLGTQPLTLSGFLVLSHVAGFMGAINSLKSRKIMPATLEYVKRANGLF